MSLPSTYTKLDYIESHGTEYFDTGFVPNGNTRVTVDFEGAAVPSVVALFGARTGMTENVFAMWLEGNQALPQYGNVVYDTKPITTTNTVRHTYDLNKGVATVDGSSVSFTNLTFSAGQSLTLLALNSNGTVDGRRPSGKLYGAKVYNNNTLVRDFIPAMNASGVIGLWDDVNSTFYTNAGTGTLTTGKKHKTLIGGTGYEVKGGRTRIGGTGYSIKKGRTLIGGTGYDISFGTSVGELDVGTSVYMDVDGASTEFLVVHQGNPNPTVYDATCNGTWVLAKNIYALVAYNSGVHGGYYEDSIIDSYAENTFLNKLDDGIQGLIKQVNITTYYYNERESISRKIFIPSRYELTIYDDFDNVTLDYFKSDTTAARVAYYNGVVNRWWLREKIFSNKAYFVETNGAIVKSTNSQNQDGFRPMFLLPSEEAKIDDDFNIIAS